MKKSFLFLLIIPFICSVNLWADRAGYRITNYTFDGVYNSNNTVTVNESITVYFDEPRHGIYHSIPLFFYNNVTPGEENPIVKEYSIKIKNYNVTGAKFTKEEEDDNFIFKVGDEKKEITGSKTYVFDYTYVFPDDRFDESDFIFYSVLGTQWETTIDRFDFKMTFENGVPEDLKIYSGDYGNDGNELNVAIRTSGNTVFGYADNLQPNNGITLYAIVPEGYFTNERVPVSKIPVILLFIAAFAVNIFSLYKVFSAKHKKPVATVEFYPPKNVTSGEVGTIMDNAADTIDLISMIPWFAHKGYLSISEEKKHLFTHTILTKLKDLPSDSPTYQKLLFNGIFAEKNVVDLKELPKDFGNTIRDSKSALFDVFKGNKKLYNHDTGIIYTLVASIITAIAFMNDTPVKYFNNFSGIVPVGLMYCFMLLREKSTFKIHFNKRPFIFLSILYIFITFIGFCFYLFEYLDISETIIPSPFSLLLLALLAVLNFFLYKIREPSDFNVEMTGKLLGLKEFIRTAEAPRIKMLVDENPEYFYDVLPYAMVFGLSDKWGKLFKDIPMEQPDWYHSTNAGLFNAAHFTSSIQSGITSTISASVAKAAASSGGGFSGGGGGGGGGGSW